MENARKGRALGVGWRLSTLALTV